ncbi:MAG TPA: (2Fe-2S)-binding protein [Xanthobacteraceae bacterium]|nr:(2Fe-2S)-binding protein [Xanthobacteraceae bacterium]
MIVCSCNFLSDHDVRQAVRDAREVPPRSANQVYGCLGCSPQCGSCARTIRQILNETLGACAKACCDGCPHGEAHAQGRNHDEIHAQGHAHDHGQPARISAMTPEAVVFA